MILVLAYGRRFEAFMPRRTSVKVRQIPTRWPTEVEKYAREAIPELRTCNHTGTTHIEWLAAREELTAEENLRHVPKEVRELADVVMSVGEGMPDAAITIETQRFSSMDRTLRDALVRGDYDGAIARLRQMGATLK